MYRLVASDMDETFLAHDHSIPQANIEAIRRMRELGVLFVPASGRSYASVVESLSSVPADLLDGTYVISYNGGTINRMGDPRPLESHSLPFETVRDLFGRGKTFGVGVHIYQCDGTVWAANLPEDDKRYLDGHMAYQEFDGVSVDFLRDVPLAKILFARHDLAFLHQMAEQIGAVPATSFTFSSGRYLEYLPEGVDKGHGLCALARILGVDVAETIAVGDSLNDLPMLEAAGLGVAVSNATDGIDGLAGYAARSSCDDGILAEVVEKFIEPQAC